MSSEAASFLLRSTGADASLVRTEPRDVPHVSYRPDIDGLRAIAVVAVVLFHAGWARASGGYVGVDVFFVISGYLITQLLIRDEAASRQSMWVFYQRRVLRILPALLTMLAVCTLVCGVVLLPDDFRSFGQNSAGTSLFSSNILFWMKTNYFDGPAQYRLLLHTWSLGVEEQFYIFFPLLLAIIRPLGAIRVRRVVAALAALSFAASVIAVAPGSTAAFYLSPLRAWEILTGSLLALGALRPLAQRWQCELAAAIGLGLIVFAVVTYSELTNFPGATALVPCAGAALILHAGGSRSCVVSRLLSTRPLVGIGLMSYSLYLWHWPMIVLAGYLAIDKLTTIEMACVVAASFAVALLSWRCVEQPFRRRFKTADPRTVIGGGLCACVAMATVGCIIALQNGFPKRFAPEVTALSSYSLSLNPLSDACGAIDLQLEANSKCTIGPASGAHIFLWGDSHAGALFGAMSKIAQGGTGTIYAATPRCPPIVGVGPTRDCIEGNDRRMRYALDHRAITTVILAARWSLYFEGRAVKLGPAERNGNVPELQDRAGVRYDPISDEALVAFRRALEETVETLLAANKKIILVYPVPELGYDVPSTAARLQARGLDADDIGIPMSLYVRREHVAVSLLDGLGQRRNLVRIYPRDELCSRDRCSAMRNGTPLYFDSHHLSIPGSEMLAPSIANAIRTLNTNGSDQATPRSL